MAVLFTACPDDYRDQSLKKFQKNKNNLPDPIKETHSGISFQISKLFDYDYNTYYAFMDDAFTRSIYEMGLYFSVDEFDEREIDVIKFSFDHDLDDADAVHQYCMRKRGNSLDAPFSSERKKIPKSIQLDGYLQVVEGATYEYNEPMDYFIATFKVADQIYVMQLIGKSGNMNYLYDDFLTILRSVN
jgi:hypothetical protein